MAQITWTQEALRMFTQEQRDEAAGGPAPQWEPPAVDYSTGDYELPVGGSRDSTGTVDPQQMFDDGFVFINSKWVKSDSAEARVYLAGAAGGGPKPTMATIVSGAVIQGGAVLGYTVPVAPAVLLPSFVGGRLGTVSMGKGMRPSSGGTERVRFAKGVLPEVRM